MSDTTHARAFVYTQPDGQRFVIGEGQTWADVRRSGRWIATDAPQEVRP